MDSTAGRSTCQRRRRWRPGRLACELSRELLHGRIPHRTCPHRRHQLTGRNRSPGAERARSFLGLRARQHRPSRTQPHHLAQDFRLVALGDDVERRAEPAQLRDDDGAGVRAGGIQHPGAPARRRADAATGRAVHRERLRPECRDGHACQGSRRHHADREIEMTRLQQLEQCGRRRDAYQQLDVGMRRPERLQMIREVDDGCGVDHAEPHPPGPALLQPIGPAREVGGEAEHLPGMRHHRRSLPGAADACASRGRTGPRRGGVRAPRGPARVPTG